MAKRLPWAVRICTHARMLSKILLLSLLTPSIVFAEIVEAEVIVYGGTAGGVAAACSSAKLGNTAALAKFGKHIGGLTSGGLGWTDIGNKAAIGGFARDFYKRLGKHYGKDEAWTFKPGVTEKDLRTLLEENGVPVKFEQRLANVKKRRLSDCRNHDGRRNGLSWPDIYRCYL
jgi:hypothetical protein